MWSSPVTKEQNILTLNTDASKTFEDYMNKINLFIADADTIMQHLDKLLNGVDCSFLKVIIYLNIFRNHSIMC